MQEFARYRTYYGNYNYSYILQWELVSQDYQSNFSKIRLRALIEVVGANNISWSRGNAVLDGTGFGLSSTYYKGVTEVYSKEKIIYHDAQGNGSAYIEGSISTSFLMNGSCGGTINLPQIPRAVNITKHEVSEIKGTSFKVSWACDKERNFTQYSLNGGNWIDAGDVVASDNRSGYYIVKNLKPNTQYTIKTRLRAADSGTWKESGTITVNTLKALFYYGKKRATLYYAKNGKWNLCIPYYGKNGKWRSGA